MSADMSADMSILHTRHLSLRMGARMLVHDLNLEIRPGQLWCVLGKNGAGKTSLLHALAGLCQPTSGSVEIDGENIAAIAPRKLAKMRGLMTQHQSDAFSQSALDTVLVGRAPYRSGAGWDSEEDVAAASAALAATGLAHLAQHDVLRLSGGERQRVALAALLAQAPHVLLLDEPTAHQDVAQQLAVFRLLRRLAGAHALIVNCHDINAAASFATHALVLAGAGHWAGTAAEVLVPEVLQQAFDCGFDWFESAQGRRYLAY
jgi:iron complex transport system ATP-binding protein